MIASFLALAQLACPQNGEPLPPETRLEVSARRAWVVVDGKEGVVFEIRSPPGGVECSMAGNVLQLRVPEGIDELTVQVPAAIAVSVTVLEGDIEIRGIRASVSAESGVGNVRVTEARGTVVAKSAAGRVEIEDVVGPITAAAQHNAVRLTRTRGDVRVSNVTGMTFLDSVEAVNLSATTVTGGVQCTCTTSGAGTWEIRAHIGGVTVSVQRGAQLVATLDAPPHAARWSLPDPAVHQDDRRRVTLTTGSRGTRMILTSFSGGVTLRERER